ncbi:MAG: class I poly(R)-hydroxyalkanoic acid synthase [Spongiibacteraceae bacterium]
MSGNDFLSQCSRWADQIFEFQRTLVEDMFTHVERNDDASEKSFVEAATECSRNLYDGLAHNPGRIVDIEIQYWQNQLQLCHNFMLKMVGEPVDPMVRPKVGDRRFIDPAWDDSTVFDFLKQSYLLTAEHCLRSVNELDGVDEKSRERLSYYVRQMVNALAPTNFAFTNPEVLRKTVETNGENLLQGLQMMVEDKRKSADVLNVCMSEPDAFVIGETIACTPGEVVAQNELMQLIQYKPVTEIVHKTPVLLVPSWVNKYYILDLTPKNSFVSYLLEQGHTVFMISWINPDERFRDVRFDDYMTHGPLAARDLILQITGEEKVAAIGYCLGGILLAATAAWANSAGEDLFASVTYLASSMDFRDPGDMGIFVDQQAVQTVERMMDRQGYFDGRLLAVGFNLLKENDLFWNYYVINYLKGERPAAMDLMHWNSDNTNVPAATHRFVMRELHLNNGLCKPGTIELKGRSIDLADIRTPTYVLGTDKDHIARWRSCYAATQLQSNSEVRFVLAGSGHIAGVINPPIANKYYHYINPETPATAEEWLDRAFKVEGSWWVDWMAWQEQFAGDFVEARQIDPASVIESAPGSFVRRRLDQIDKSRQQAA